RMTMLAGDARGLLAVPAEEFCRIGYFTTCIRQGLSVLERDQLRQLPGMACHQFEPAAQDFRALPGWRRPPTFGRLFGRIDGPHCVRDRGVGDRGKGPARTRINYWNACAGLPLPADIEVAGVKRRIGKIEIAAFDVHLASFRCQSIKLASPM